MSNESMNVDTPSWINIGLARKVHPDTKAIASVETATKPGDNYVSVIYRMILQLNDGSKQSFVIKTLPPGGGMKNWANETGVFVRETTMLVEIIPHMEALLEEAAPGRWGHLAARCPLHGNSPETFIVMEDLRSQGFQMADRKRGLGLRHSLIVMRCLARYHAAGHLLLKKDPELIGRMDNFHRKEPEGVAYFYEGGVAAAAEACRTWPGYEECARRLDKFKIVMMKTIKELNEPKLDSFNVILHGDFKTNNIMFRYDAEGNPSEIRLVDLQLCQAGSPAIDILYFLSTSLSEEVSTHHQDLLIREYYFALQEALSLLGTEILSFETLLADIDAHGPHVIMGAISVSPMEKSSKPTDLEAIMSGDPTAHAYLYSLPEVRKYLQRVLPEFVRKGWLPA